MGSTARPRSSSAGGWEENASRENRPKEMNPNPRDDFGRRKNLQLGIPQSSTCHRLLDVSPDLAMVIIRAHIAEKRAKLDALNAQAKMEAESGVAA
jgi:hypothetical protein